MSLEVQKEGREVIYSRMAKRRINRTFCARATYAWSPCKWMRLRISFSGN